MSEHFSPIGVPREAEACPGRGGGVYGWLQQLRARRRGPWRHDVSWEVVEAEGEAEAEVELGHRLKMRELAHELSGREAEADEAELGQRPSESGPGRGLLRAQSTGSSAGAPGLGVVGGEGGGVASRWGEGAGGGARAPAIP
jgi:hypothetical protein